MQWSLLMHTEKYQVNKMKIESPSEEFLGDVGEKAKYHLGKSPDDWRIFSPLEGSAL